MSHLSETIEAAAAEQGISRRGIHREATKRGYTIGLTTIARYMNGDHPDPPAQEVLRLFSEVLRIPLAELEKLSSQRPTGLPFRLPPEADRLDDQERKVILSMVELLASRKAPTPTGSPDDYGLVAKTDDGQRIDPDLL